VNRLGNLLRLPGRIPTVLRTVARLRARQAWAQLAHLFSGVEKPAQLDAHEIGLAVTEATTAFLGPPAHVGVHVTPRGGLELELLALGLLLERSEIDWQTDRHGPLFAYHLHEQAWLRHPKLKATDRATVVEDWMENHVEGVGWDPHPISLRLLSWGKALLTEGLLPKNAALRGRMCRSMADQAETLARGLEIRLQANHLLSNRIGVVWAGLLFTGAHADRWLGGCDALLAEFEAQVHRDGVHEERSPMYHSLILENGLDLLNLSRVSPRTPPGFADNLAATLRRMLDALALFTGPDGRITLLADSGWGVAAEPDALFDYACALGVIEAAPDPSELRFDDSGYVRLASDRFDVVVSIGAPSPAHQPGHAHCDALAFELFVRGQRLVADTGVFENRPGDPRTLARATTSHATLAFDGREQSEIWSAHRVGGRAKIGISDAGPDFLVLEVTGWTRGAPKHARQIFCELDHVVVKDVVRAGGHTVESRLPFAPEWTVELKGDRARCRHESARVVVEIELDGDLAWTVERAPFYPSFHREVERDVLVGRGVTPCESEIVFRSGGAVKRRRGTR